MCKSYGVVDSDSSVSTILLAALPSHSSGILPSFLNPFLKCSNALTIPSFDVPARIFVPSVIVIGLSVLLRIVKQEIPSTVVFSWSPPLSVIINEAFFPKNNDSLNPSEERYCIGGLKRWLLKLTHFSPRLKCVNMLSEGIKFTYVNFERKVIDISHG